MKASTIFKVQRNFKIFPVMSHLNNSFQEMYLPNWDISIVISLTPWKGRLSFKQYIPLKASKFGIKLTSCVMLPLSMYGPFLYM
jgi:hypothetical protein